MAVHADVFKHALGHFASGVTVVTLANENTKTGITVTAFCSVSLDPPYILISVNKESYSLDILKDNPMFVVNFLAANQQDVSNQFASKSKDKFQGISHHIEKLGLPVLDNTLGFLECKVVNQVSAGDHDLLIGLVENAGIDDTKRPLLYFHGTYDELKRASE
ncbi:flavin reductase family protein [Alicyclobacillus sp. SO9]|uniref:flavin reductase family protein n=1 Tax=Alicyclobacillus sp. SO9 TaxID=2665646 RepID=UPI0018E6F9A7|nr:flavin reductase family protein [Alicyclobacillus sp. SO9]QQE77151.1 flavin reductase family protein [Alicyclobacillus sp. SO9]